MKVAVIGLGRFGSRLAENLSRADVEVIAIDKNRNLVEEMRDKVTLAVALDATDEQSLRMQGIDKVDVAVVGIGQEFESNLLATVTLRSLGIKKVISRATSDVRSEILTRVGADDVAKPEDESADRWTHRLLSDHIVEQLPLSATHSLVEIVPPADWQGKTLSDLSLRSAYRINVVLIKRKPASQDGEPDTVFDTPLPNSIIQPSDTLLVVGTNADLKQLPD